jgi:1-acyl-sn-glycerol-3-phosphate acyltransferase
MWLAIGVGTVTLSFGAKLLALWSSDHHSWDGTKPNWFAKIYFGNILSFARFWNDYEIHGLENVPNRNCLLVGYHSRCTLDLLYLGAAIRPAMIVSHIFYSFPGLGWLNDSLGCISSGKGSSSADTAFVQAVVNGNKPVMLLPGGAFECEKSYEDRYKIQWKELPGFARVLLQEPHRPGCKTSVVPFFTSHCEDLYYTNPWWYTYSGKWLRAAFDRLRDRQPVSIPALLCMCLMALGVFIAPRPVKLDLYFGTPLVPLDKESDIEFAKRVKTAAQTLVDEVNARSQEKSLSHPNRGINKYFRYPLYGLYVVGQNSCVALWIILNVTVALPIALGVVWIWKKIFRQSKNDKKNNKKGE